MNQPKPRQIRLPFAVPKPGRSKGQSRTCGICRRNEGKYTCPRCNLVYCSLACFRDQAHTQCSESFYKSTVMDQIAADPQAGLDDKKAMMEMLRRFEDQASTDGQNTGGDADEDDDEDEDELERRLKDIDLDDIDSNKLFHLLPQEHRDAFIAAIRDPDSEAGRELLELTKEDGEDDPILPSVLPWWEASELSDDIDDGNDGDGMDYADAPEMVSEEESKGVIPPEGVGRKLVFNALAICLAYLHTLLSFRLPSLDEPYLADSEIEIADLKIEIARLIPFLADQKSTIRHTSAREAYSSVWERIATEDTSVPNTEILIRLLNSLISLVHPPITTDPPRIHLALSDLYRLFSRNKIGPASKKLRFYLAALRQLDRQDWLGVERELRKEVDRLQSELGNNENTDEEAPTRERLLL